MKPNQCVILFLLPLVMFSIAETENGAKKRDDITQKSNSEEETEDKIVEDVENVLERLHELKALHESILKFIPDAFLNEKIPKQLKEESESESEEPAENTLKDGELWMKTMISQSKAIDVMNTNMQSVEDEDLTSWVDQEQYQNSEEEVKEPLTPEQQEGKGKLYINYYILCFKF